MPSPSKNFTVIPDTAVDPDSPLDTTLMTALRDNDLHIEEWLGKDYTAAQNHNHDGTNSALVEIGPNYLRNGSFEDGTTGWSLSNYTGGGNAISTTNQYDGLSSLELTSTVLANGGSQATSNAYISVSGGEARALNFSVQASVANVSSKVEAIWYDKDKAQISTTSIYSSVNTPTTWTRERMGVVAPTAARFMRVRLTGGVPASGGSTGTVRFDGISLSAAGSGIIKVLTGVFISISELDLVMTDFAAYRNKKLVLNSVAPASDGASLRLQFSSNGGSSFSTGASDYTWAYSSNLANSSPNDPGSTADAAIVLALAVGSGTSESVNAEVDLFDTNISGAATRALFKCSSFSTLGTLLSIRGAGGLVATPVTDALRISFGVGNIAAIAYSLYVWN